MKVLFLDIDGVLNSAMYEPYTDDKGVFYFIDETRLPLLRKIIDATGAKIVLSSTWRDTWEKDKITDINGVYITKLFAKYGLFIYDKTPMSDNYFNRKNEVLEWLQNCAEHVSDFAILDDDDFDWGEISSRVVKTEPRNGYGLEQVIADKVIALLTECENVSHKRCIIEYTNNYAEQLKDLFVELQAHISSLDDRGVIVLKDGYRDAYFNYIIGEIKKHDGIIYLALDGGTAVGAVVCKVFQGGEEADITTSCPKIGFVSDLVVSKACRNNGIGTALLQKAEEYFNMCLCDYMQLEVFEPNVGALKLYERYGMSTIVRYMSKKLSG